MFLDRSDQYKRQRDALKVESAEMAAFAAELDSAASFVTSLLGEPYEKSGLEVMWESGIEYFSEPRQTYLYHVVRMKGNPLEIQITFPNDGTPFVMAEKIARQVPRKKISVVG